MTTQTIEDIRSAFEQFKKLNDARLDEIEKYGTASNAAQEAADRANKAISDLQNKLDGGLGDIDTRLQELTDRQNRLAAGGRGWKPSDSQIVQYANWQSVITGRTVDPANVDLELVKRYGNAFNDWFRNGNDAELKAIKNEMSVGSDPDGGYWVDPDTSGRIATLVYETSPVRQFASQQTISTDALEGTTDLDEAGTGGWVAENATRSGNTATPTVGAWRIPVYEQYAEPRATQKLLDDAMIDVGAWLSGKVSSKLSRDENTAFCTGAGAVKPRGFMTYAAGAPTASDWQKIEQIVSGSAAALTTGGLIDLVYSLKSVYRQGSIFAMNRATEGAVRKLVDGNGNYIWQPNFQVRNAAALLGYPVAEFADLADIAANALPIAFGNFGEAYQVVDRAGISVLRDPYTTKGYVKFYTTKRVGGDVINFEALKIQKCST